MKDCHIIGLDFEKRKAAGLHLIYRVRPAASPGGLIG